jgi:hypothetical protein
MRDLFRNTYQWFAFFMLLGVMPVSAQAPLETELLWHELEELIKKGNPIALRDIATFLDKPAFAERTRILLTKHSFFTKAEIDVSRTNREAFLHFYYDHQNALKYSEVLNAFYLSPIEYQEAMIMDFNPIQPADDTHIGNPKKVIQETNSLKSAILHFDSLIQKRASDIDFQSVIRTIVALQTPESYEWARQKLVEEPFGQRYSENYQILCEALKYDPSVLSLKTVLTAIEHGLVREEMLSDVFLEMTNMLLSARKCQVMLDSLGSIEALRALGYESSLRFKESFFYHRVDYFGKILSSAETPHWIQRNALRDLIETHHPRSLFFIAAQTRLKTNEQDIFLNTLYKLTGFSSPKPASSTQTLAEIDYWKNYLRWWAVHAEDFVWDDAENKFIDKASVMARTEAIEKLLRRLGSTNDSVAIASYQQLTHYPPSVILPMIEKFRPLIRNYNPELPDLNAPYLETLTQLTELCRKQNIALTQTPELDSLLTRLAHLPEHLDAHIHRLENQIVQLFESKIPPSEIIAGLTALEYYGLVHATDRQMNFSISRLLDRLYTRHWDKIAANDLSLRFYIKKMALFQALDVAGSSALYHKKLNRQDSLLRQKLENMARLKTDREIRTTIFQWLNPLVGQPKELFSEAQTPDTLRQNLTEKLRILAAMPEVLIDELNEIVRDGQFKDSYKPLVLLVLKKISPLSSLRNFALKNWLKAQTDLVAFESLSIAAKDLDDVLRIFEPDALPQSDFNGKAAIWQFIHKKTAAYSPDELGVFWNAMFKVNWFTDLVYADGLPTAERDTILAALQNYLNTNELLSEFEEQTTLTHILELENIGRSLADKLEATIALDASEITKASVQAAILARIQYADIGTVASFAPRLSRRTPAESPLQFLRTDFGIPLSMEDTESLTQLIENHRLLSPKDFYAHYLKAFDLAIWHMPKTAENTVHRTPFMGEGEQLDYQKVYDLLCFESVVPFTGGGERRELFIYGLIKYLELIHKTSLGFHEKLNENQTFYTYNAAKRAAAWRAYLIAEKWVKPVDAAPSFSE